MKRERRRQNIVVAVAVDEHQRAYLDAGKRLLGTRSAVLRAALDYAMAAGVTFGAVVLPDAARKTGAL